jgi:hypothetical protein
VDGCVEPNAENTKISEIKAEVNPCKVATPQLKDKMTPCVNKSFSKLIVDVVFDELLMLLK